MKGGSPRRRGNAGWRKTPMDLGKAAEMLRDYASPCAGDPITAFVFFDGRGRHRRITASYAGAWNLQINFDLAGKVSSYQLACTLRAVVPGKAVAGTAAVSDRPPGVHDTIADSDGDDGA